MTNPYTTPTPPAPRPPDTRPLRRRKRVWLGGAGLFLAGALIASPSSDNGKEPATAKIAPAPTVTVAATTTVTATPAPAATVTITPKPAPTVTVTETTTAEAADTTSDDTPSGTCSIVSKAGNCYSAGQYCRNSDHGATTTNASGASITCKYRSNGWRWTYS